MASASCFFRLGLTGQRSQRADRQVRQRSLRVFRIPTTVMPGRWCASSQAATRVGARATRTRTPCSAASASTSLRDRQPARRSRGQARWRRTRRRDRRATRRAASTRARSRTRARHACQTTCHGRDNRSRLHHPLVTHEEVKTVKLVLGKANGKPKKASCLHSFMCDKF